MLENKQMGNGSYNNIYIYIYFLYLALRNASLFFRNVIQKTATLYNASCLLFRDAFFPMIHAWDRER
nr:hypothetical protein Q903MT_gene1663 [Picea sitchensis]